MEISDVYMIIGFTLAAYSVVANDSVQTLGTVSYTHLTLPTTMLV